MSRSKLHRVGNYRYIILTHNIEATGDILNATITFYNIEIINKGRKEVIVISVRYEKTDALLGCIAIGTDIGPYLQHCWPVSSADFGDQLLRDWDGMCGVYRDRGI